MGFVVGSREGIFVGRAVEGDEEGFAVGSSVGFAVGLNVGNCVEGFEVGSAEVGIAEGSDVGSLKTQQNQN